MPSPMVDLPVTDAMEGRNKQVCSVKRICFNFKSTAEWCKAIVRVAPFYAFNEATSVDL